MTKYCFNYLFGCIKIQPLKHKQKCSINIDNKFIIVEKYDQKKQNKTKTKQKMTRLKKQTYNSNQQQDIW